MRWRRWLKRIFVAGLLLALVIAGGFFLLHPPLMERTEIYRGVFLTVEDVPRGTGGHGQAMIVEVHWDVPGVRLAGREYSFPVDAVNPVDPHYRLVPADWALWRSGASVLVNTAGYTPESPLRSLPGMPVRAVESLVVDGRPSHVHPHSYLLYWDRQMEVHINREKPPDPDTLTQATLAIGLQGWPILEGAVRPHALDHKDQIMPRTFIGVDPERKILYLMAFEQASGNLMLERALEAGVRHGGMLDSGDATHLLIGAGANGIGPHNGIRHWRPLGPCLYVFADPIQH